MPLRISQSRNSMQEKNENTTIREISWSKCKRRKTGRTWRNRRSEMRSWGTSKSWGLSWTSWGSSIWEKLRPKVPAQNREVTSLRRPWWIRASHLIWYANKHLDWAETYRVGDHRQLPLSMKLRNNLCTTANTSLQLQAKSTSRRPSSNTQAVPTNNSRGSRSYKTRSTRKTTRKETKSTK